MDVITKELSTPAPVTVPSGSTWTQLTLNRPGESSGLMVRVVTGTAVEIGPDSWKTAGSVGMYQADAGQTVFIPVPAGLGHIWALSAAGATLVVEEVKGMHQ